MKKITILFSFLLLAFTSFSQVFVGSDGKLHSASTGGAIGNLNEVSFSTDTTNFKQGWAKLGSIVYYYDSYWKVFNNGGGTTPAYKYFPIFNSAIFLSHSLGEGYNADGATITTPYPYFVAKYSGVVDYTNYSHSGQGIRNEYFNYVKFNGATPKTSGISVMLGTNELRGGTDTTHRFKHMRAGFRAAAAAHFTNSIQFYKQGTGTTNSNVTNSSSSNFYTPTLDTISDWGSRAYYYRLFDPLGYGTNFWIKKNITANENVTITNVSGANLAIGTWACDGVRTIMSRIEVRVDGVLKTTYDPNGQTYSTGALCNPEDTSYYGSGTFRRVGIINDAIMINGLRDTTHTIVLTFLDAGTIGAWDYVAGLKQPQVAKRTPFFLWDIPHCDSLGYHYQGYTFYEWQLDSSSNASYRDLVQNFPNYPIARVQSNKYFNPLDPRQIQSDGLHPTAAGDSALALAYSEIIDSFLVNSNVQTPSSGLTAQNGLLTNDLITGKSGGQTIIGGTLQLDKLNLKASRFNAGTTGADTAIIFKSGNSLGYDYLAHLNNFGDLYLQGKTITTQVRTSSVNNVDGGILELGGYNIVSARISHTDVLFDAGVTFKSKLTNQTAFSTKAISSQTGDLMHVDPTTSDSGGYFKIDITGLTTIAKVVVKDTLKANTIVKTGGTSAQLLLADGSVGAYVDTTIEAVSGLTNYSSSATYQQVNSITLPAGNWDLSASGTFSSNAATLTAASNAIFVVSTTNNSAAGSTIGKDIMYIPQAALVGTSIQSTSSVTFKVTPSTTTTYYLNTQATFTLGTPQFAGFIRARRIR